MKKKPLSNAERLFVTDKVRISNSFIADVKKIVGLGK